MKNKAFRGIEYEIKICESTRRRYVTTDTAL